MCCSFFKHFFKITLKLKRKILMCVGHSSMTHPHFCVHSGAKFFEAQKSLPFKKEQILQAAPSQSLVKQVQQKVCNNNILLCGITMLWHITLAMFSFYLTMIDLPVQPIVHDAVNVEVGHMKIPFGGNSHPRLDLGPCALAGVEEVKTLFPKFCS